MMNIVPQNQKNMSHKTSKQFPSKVPLSGDPTTLIAGETCTGLGPGNWWKWWKSGHPPNTALSIWMRAFVYMITVYNYIYLIPSDVRTWYPYRVCTNVCTISQYLIKTIYVCIQIQITSQNKTLASLKSCLIQPPFYYFLAFQTAFPHTSQALPVIQPQHQLQLCHSS